MARVSREVWAKRVERWKDSGLSAKEFAAELDVSPNTLTFWKWKLRKDETVPAAPSVGARRTNEARISLGSVKQRSATVGGAALLNPRIACGRARRVAPCGETARGRPQRSPRLHPAECCRARESAVGARFCKSGQRQAQLRLLHVRRSGRSRRRLRCEA
jgi:hypothetical protein